MSPYINGKNRLKFCMVIKTTSTSVIGARHPCAAIYSYIVQKHLRSPVPCAYSLLSQQNSKISVSENGKVQTADSDRNLGYAPALP